MKRMMDYLSLLAILFGIALGASPASSQTFTTIDYPGAISTQAEGISGSNIVGNYTTSSSGEYGFVYNGSTYTTLAMPGAQYTSAVGISGSNIVGNYTSSSGTTYGFVYNGSTWTTIDYRVTGISGSNIIGNAEGKQEFGGQVSDGFLYNGSTYTTLDDPAGIGYTNLTGIDGNNIVGWYVYQPFRTMGFLYDGSGFQSIFYPESPLTYPTGISGSNIVGYSGEYGFVYNGSTYTNLYGPMGAELFLLASMATTSLAGIWTRREINTGLKLLSLPPNLPPSPC